MLGGMDDVIIDEALDSIEASDGDGEIWGDGNNGILNGRLRVT